MSTVQNEVYAIPFRLKVARISRNYKNKYVFALSCGARVSTYRAHENGNSMIKANDIVNYCYSLDISIRWLLTGEGTPPLDHKENPDSSELAKFECHAHLEKIKYQVKKKIKRHHKNKTWKLSSDS